MGLRFEYITSREELLKGLEKLEKDSFVFLDTETVSDRIRLVQIGNSDHIFVVDMYYVGPVGMEYLKSFLSERGIVGHNLKFDLKYLLKYSVEPYAVFDTMIASQLLGEADRHSLQHVSMHYLGLVLDKSLQLSNWGSPKLSKEQLEYAALDVKVVRDLFLLLRDKLNETAYEEPTLLKTRTAKVFGLRNPVAIIEMAFVMEVAKLELNGLPVDEETLNKRLEELKKDLQNRVMDFYIKHRVDPMSPKQLGEYLLKRGVDLPRTEKGNVSTDDKVLSEYADHPVVSQVLSIRSTKKLVERLEDVKKHIINGRVYPEFKQIGAVTGRMASLSPNVQNIPRSLRDIFKAEEGHTFVIGDFSQIELRIASEYVGDERMIRAFMEGKDLHKYTASLLLGKKEEDVTKEERQLAKAVNFGLIYGISAKGLSEYAKSYGIDLPVDRAQEIRKMFFEYYTGFREWHERVKRELKAKEYSEGTTLLGRKYIARTFPDAVNYPIQGSGADLLKLAVLMFMAGSRRLHLSARLVNLVHDEIVVECKEEEAQRVKELLEEEMKRAGSIVLKRVPVEVETAINQRWVKD